MRRLAAILVLLLLVPFAPTAAAPPPTLVFGSAVSLSGPLATEGRLTKEGYDFWAAYVNAHGGLRAGTQRYQVEIRYADDQSNPETTAAAMTALLDQQHVDFLLGPYGSAPTFAAAAVAERERVPMAEGSGAAERIFNQGYHYTFGVLSPARKYLVGIIEFAVRRKPRPHTIAISAADDAFSLEVQQGAVESANDHGFRVVYSDHYDGSPASIDAAAAAIAATSPDIVLNAGHVQDALQLQRALKAHHVVAAAYGYTNGPDTPTFRSTLGPDAQAVLGSAQWSSSVVYKGAPGFYRTAREYDAAFRRAYGRPPDYHNAQATAACLAFQYAIARAGAVDRPSVRDALATLDVVTFFGLLKFDARGLNMWKPMVVNQVQGDRLITIYPYRIAEGQPIYPAPPWHS